MKKSFLGFVLIAFGLAVSTECFAPTTGAQSVTFSIPAVSVLTISGDVAFGTFGTPAAGSDFTQINNTNSTYSVTNNAGSGSRKITAQLAAALPAGMNLGVGMATPTGASGGAQQLMNGTNAATIVTGIGNGAFSNYAILYTLFAGVASTAVGSGTISITYTLVAS